MFHTGTSAVKSQEIKDPGMMDNFLTGLFQIGGKFLWPHDKAVLAVGHINDLIGDRPMFMPLNKYFREYGGVYKLSFAPVPQATFYVLSDPHAIKHVLKDCPNDFDKVRMRMTGLLSEILEPILGKGLIPADPETWRQRRPVIQIRFNCTSLLDITIESIYIAIIAIPLPTSLLTLPHYRSSPLHQPGFHMRWLERMTMTFNECASILIDKLEGEAEAGNLVDMEGMFNSVSLDIIGKAVFNYEFGSVTRESPVIKVDPPSPPSSLLSTVEALFPSTSSLTPPPPSPLLLSCASLHFVLASGAWTQLSSLPAAFTPPNRPMTCDLQAAYACLKEAEHRSTFLLPYWNVPFLGQGKFSVVPRQREFADHLEVRKGKRQGKEEEEKRDRKLASTRGGGGGC
eukprot:750446-Hanusia_phi.AAC.3